MAFLRSSTAYHTAFVGRQSELDDLSRLLTETPCQLLTLVGLGGIGKTRLALEVAQRVQTSFQDGVYFVPLQPLQSPNQIIQAVLNALSLEADRDPRAHLLAYLSERQLLLVMDNFEHLLDGINLVVDILNSAAQVKILATSRESLRLQEEWLRAVHGLEYPDDTATLLNGHHSAVQLFVQRAQQLRVDLDFDAQYAHIVRICRLVDGMPLALELAAGWVKTLSCREIAEELQRNRDILAARSKDRPERHRSMQAVFDHSWSLLTEDEQAVLRRFAVFRGGCTREAAEQITGATLSSLVELVEKSLLRHDPDRGRYDMQELLRQYVHERLEESDEEDRVRDRHSHYYTALCHVRPEIAYGPEKAAFLNQVSAELDNVRVSWAWALEREDYEVIDQLVDTLTMYYNDHSRTIELGTMCQAAVARLATCHGKRERAILGRVLARQGKWTSMQSRIDEAEALLRQSIAIAREQNNLDELYDTQRALAWWILAICRHEYATALPMLEECVAYFREQDNKRQLGWALMTLARVCGKMGQSERQETLLVESYRLYQSMNYQKGMNDALMFLGYKAMNEGRWAEAQQFLHELIERDKTYGAGVNRFNAVRAYAILMMVAVMQGDFALAEQHGQAVTDIRGPHKVHHIDFKVTLHCNLSQSLILDANGAAKEALRLADEATASAELRGDMPEVVDRGRLIHAWVRCSLGDFGAASCKLAEILADATAEFYRVTGHLTFAIAIAARILARSGKQTLAAELLGLVFTHPNSPQGYLQHHPQMVQLCDDLEHQLGVDAYDAAWEQGTRLEPERVARRLRQELTGDADVLSTGTNHALLDPLTDRELEVLARMVEGCTNREIAGQLYISVNTVKKHVNHIFSKLDVTNRGQAIAQTRRLSLLS